MDGIRSEAIVLRGTGVRCCEPTRRRMRRAGALTQLVLHALAAGGVFVLDLIRPLSAYGPVVAPDLPGSIFGHTGTPHPRAPRVELNARFVRALTSALSVRTACVHGSSGGAAVALRFALPDRVTGVVLVNRRCQSR